MGHAPRHLAPGQGALIALHRRDVFQQGHRAFRLGVFVLQRQQGHLDDDRLAVRQQCQVAGDLPLGFSAQFFQHIVQQFHQFPPEHHPVVPALPALLPGWHEALGAAVESRDVALLAERDDARIDVLQQQLHQPVALPQLVVAVEQILGGVQQLQVLFLELPAHRIERVDQPVEVGFQRSQAGLIHLISQFSLRDAMGGIVQPFDGCHEAPRQIERDPGGGEDDEQGHDDEKRQQRRCQIAAEEPAALLAVQGGQRAGQLGRCQFQHFHLQRTIGQGQQQTPQGAFLKALAPIKAVG